jgi:hypothetical protein
MDVSPRQIKYLGITLLRQDDGRYLYAVVESRQARGTIGRHVVARGILDDPAGLADAPPSRLAHFVASALRRLAL